MLVLVGAHFLDRSVTPVAADVDLSSEVHHQSPIAYIGIGFERWSYQNTHHIMNKDRYFESLTFGLSSTLKNQCQQRM
ncbi:hypothetical protein T07_9989 [Trichinella nelsoni]|uniref:Uncharacterized protein n=1 Tax=Trichinella nelsoni TaxID=6336 RepID=A0A0V0SAY2_9BILA|nr:hypothetical protein T07_9989 [Trichinella nelsoni]